MSSVQFMALLWGGDGGWYGRARAVGGGRKSRARTRVAPQRGPPGVPVEQRCGRGRAGREGGAAPRLARRLPVEGRRRTDPLRGQGGRLALARADLPRGTRCPSPRHAAPAPRDGR